MTSRRASRTRGFRVGVQFAVILAGAASCSETLGDVPKPALIEIAPFSTEIAIGASATLYASVLDSHGRVITQAGNVKWTSTTPTVASVDANGKVTGVAAGTTRITAQLGGALGAASVRVRLPAPSRVDVPAPTGALARGDTVRISARALDGAGGLYPGRAFAWRTSDASIVNLVASADSTSALLTAIAPGTATISASNLGVEGTLNITVSADPVIEFAPATAQLFATQGNATPATAEIAIRNAGGGTLRGLSVAAIAYAQTAAAGWLQATLGGTPAAPTLSLRATSGALTVGNYAATVTLNSTAPAVLPRTIDVTLAVTPPPAITVASTSVSFAAALAGAPPTTQRVAITNGGGGTLSGLAVAAPVTPAGQPAPWLTATLSSTTAPADLQLAVNQGALAIGTYDANVSVSAPGALGSPKVVAVRLRVDKNALIALSPSSVSLSAAVGGNPAPATIAVTNGGGGTLSGLSLGTPSYGAGATNWLTASINATTAPATITVSATSTALAAGTYTATLPVTSSLAGVPSVSVGVTLTVQQPGVIVASTARVSLNATATVAGPSATVGITNSGAGSLSGLTASTTYFAGQPTGWLSASFAGNTTTAPTSLVLQALAGVLEVGTYSATVTLRSPNAAASVDIVVTFNVAGGIGTSPAVLLFVPLGASGSGPVSSNVTNSGAGVVTGLASSFTYQSGSNWLTTATLAGTTTPTTLQLEAKADAVSVRGVSTATVTITGKNVSPATVQVTRRVGYTYERHIVSTNTNVFQNMGCTSCHDGSGGPALNFDDYDALTAPQYPYPYINRNSPNPLDSYLYAYVTSGGHGGGNYSGNPTLAIVRAWIEDGARRR